ncbi:hypothetical protein N9B73_13295 [Verrucomicrobiales bacterium]|nr:hypothetical protein [Verrucomicrobiales bacterium]
MKRISILPAISLFIAGLTSQLSAQTSPKPISPTPTERIALWPGKAPVGNGKFEDSDLHLEVFLPPADKANGAAIVLCPGGGYIRPSSISSNSLIIVLSGYWRTTRSCGKRWSPCRSNRVSSFNSILAEESRWMRG